MSAAPWVFVLIWSTGFIVARYGMPHAPPFTFLCWRYALSVIAFALWMRAAGVPWPRGRDQWKHLAVSGALMHAGYLGGVWSAVKAGIPAGTVALIVGLQPLLTAAWVSWRGEHRISRTQWLGLLLGFGGLSLVVWHKLGAGEVNATNLMLSIGALICITVGTLYQKRFVKAGDPRGANAVQVIAALLVSLPIAALESGGMEWHPQLIGALIWSVLGLSLLGSSLLVMLIQRGAATQVTSLLYLVPPCTAVMAWWLFGEAMGGLAMLGMLLCALGVGWVVRNAGESASARV